VIPPSSDDDHLGNLFQISWGKLAKPYLNEQDVPILYKYNLPITEDDLFEIAEMCHSQDNISQFRKLKYAQYTKALNEFVYRYYENYKYLSDIPKLHKLHHK